MSVPLDRLYNFLHDVCNRDDILIYRFFPHGSKKIEDLTVLNDFSLNKARTEKYMLCNDQEPLQWDTYSKGPNCTINLRSVLEEHGAAFNKVLLVHSEQRSVEVERYRANRFIDVYYWSHALIARDWFRYAALDPILQKSKELTHDFLVYNRAWTGTREYRLKFTEMIVDCGLVDNCLMRFNPKDEHTHYTRHKFSNPEFDITRYDFEDHLPPVDVDATASADYVNSEYLSTGIEVVLETLFDDQRLHLTEKSLRPIACGQPFILAATHGSLEYLRSYGFRTFDGLINETYDTLEDPVQRLEEIVRELQRIAKLDLQKKQLLYHKLQEIANHNKNHFFSDAFTNQVITEYKTNLDQALNILT